jgi:hypothetical protein
LQGDDSVVECVYNTQRNPPVRSFVSYNKGLSNVRLVMASANNTLVSPVAGGYFSNKMWCSMIYNMDRRRDLLPPEQDKVRESIFHSATVHRYSIFGTGQRIIYCSRAAPPIHLVGD